MAMTSLKLASYSTVSLYLLGGPEKTCFLQGGGGQRKLVSTGGGGAEKTCFYRGGGGQRKLVSTGGGGVGGGGGGGGSYKS